MLHAVKALTGHRQGLPYRQPLSRNLEAGRNLRWGPLASIGVPTNFLWEGCHPTARTQAGCPVE
jgi:hypothetical protein